MERCVDPLPSLLLLKVNPNLPNAFSERKISGLSCKCSKCTHLCKKQCTLSDMTEYTLPLHFNHRQNLPPPPPEPTSHTLPTIVTSCTQTMNILVPTEDPRRFGWYMEITCEHANPRSNTIVLCLQLIPPTGSDSLSMVTDEFLFIISWCQKIMA